MNDEDDIEIIMSDLCRTYTERNKSIEVEIYKGVDDEGWFLEILDQYGNSMLWDEMFKTEQEALAQFESDLKKEGIDIFIGKKD